MSSRNIRRLMQEREKEQKQSEARLTEVEKDEGRAVAEDSSDESPIQPRKATKGKMNAFDMLQEVQEESENDTDASAYKLQENTSHLDMITADAQPQQQAKASKRKKKRKAKQKSKEAVGVAKLKDESIPGDEADSGDEIDRALQELETTKTKAAHSSDDGFDSEEHHRSWERDVSKLLSAETQHLNPINEMKRLFGRIALERPSRQNQQTQQGLMVDLETALNGKHSPASRGKELGGLAKRRNILMQGQENWPLAFSGGLGMEAVDRPEVDVENFPDSHFGKHFDIVHRSTYEGTQLQFKQEVEVGSPDRLISLLVHNPYHVVTLLQVSEIARHQGDHAVAGDLLERALYIYGRSVHSTFSVAFREGRARLAFDRVENRELYLTIWRYVRNLEMRGTWRTAFEWAKCLLSFSMLSDPYSMTLVLDQYALRARQYSALISLCSEEAFGSTWSHLPNMQISLALAYFRTAEPRLARQKLAVAMHRYPYILSRLCSELEIEPIPTTLWGKLPNTDGEKFFTELYVSRAKDIWQTPETTSLLVEVAQTLNSYTEYWSHLTPAPALQISFEDARHVYLLESPALIALVPRNYRSFPTSQYDVLPPPPSINSTNLAARAPPTTTQTPNGIIGNFISLVRTMFSNNAPTATVPNVPNVPDVPDVPPQVALERALADTNLDEANRRAIIDALNELSFSEDSDSGPNLPNEQVAGAANTNDNPINADAEQVGWGIGTGNPLAATVADASDSDADADPNDGNLARPPAQIDPTGFAPTPAVVQNIQRWLLSVGLNMVQTSFSDSITDTSGLVTTPDPEALDSYLQQLRRLRPRDKQWVLRIIEQRLGESGKGVWAAIRDAQ